ncbi:MAG TPA: DnaJ domain-containing protein [Bryobacteraceae bacterium]|nr:DnaJ domain-containing protein [Bryobacteraceae bacterium]
MSSSVSGKFQDYYIVLGVEPNADSDTIQAAYTQLARTYHPSNRETGDQKKFDDLNAAYEVLSDPALRIEFDKLKGVDRDSGNPVFAGAAFFEALKRGAALRATILCLLCDRRRIKPTSPSMSLRHLETMLRITNDELTFVMWYLKQRAYVVSDDKSNLQISVEGLDYLERNTPLPEVVLQLVKPEALAPNAIPPAAATQALNLDRALRREQSQPISALLEKVRRS